MAHAVVQLKDHGVFEPGAEVYAADFKARKIVLRVQEIALLISGEKITPSRLQHARQLLGSHYEQGNPTLDSFNAIMDALGYELQVKRKASGD